MECFQFEITSGGDVVW